MNLKHVLGLAAAASLAVPAVAGAHSSVWETDARDGLAATFTHHYVVYNHGHTIAYRETNGAAAGGVINYKRLPVAWRNDPTVTDDVDERLDRILGAAPAGGDTGVQTHATCDVAALETNAVISSWQGGHVVTTDPFWGYIPFQTASAGLDDDPADWLAVLDADFGIQAEDIDTPAEAEAVCEAPAGLNGTYVPADTVQTDAASLAEGEVAPLEAQIALLTGRAAELNTQLNDALAAKTAAEGKPPITHTVRVEVPVPSSTPAPTTRPLALTLAGKAFSAGQVIAQVTGPANGAAKVAVTVSAADQRKLGLTSRTVVTATRRLGAAGAQLFVLNAARSTKTALRKAAKATPVTITATSGRETKSGKATLR